MAEVLLIWHKTQINQSIDQNGVNPMFEYSINTLFLYKWCLCNPLMTSIVFTIFHQVAEEILTLAYESGINFFDTAEVYAAGK